MVKRLEAEDIWFVFVDEINCGFPYGVCTAFHSAFNRSEENAQAVRREVSGGTNRLSRLRPESVQSPRAQRCQETKRGVGCREVSRPLACVVHRALAPRGRSLLTIELIELLGVELLGLAKVLRSWYKALEVRFRGVKRARVF